MKRRYAEPLGHGEERIFTVEEVLFEGDTRFQHVDIIRAEGYGLVLFLNGERQSSQADEFIYHECLVQPAMFRHPEPTDVLIIGGGEGAVAREVLRHRSVDAVTQVDIDGELIDLCREHLPTWSDGAYEDPRMNLIIGDGLAYLREEDTGYDVIILDIPEWSEDSPARQLYTVDFYRLVASRLREGGVMALQVGPVHPVHIDAWLRPTTRLIDVFTGTLFYSAPELRWGFGVCANAPFDEGLFDVTRLSSSLRYYNAQMHTALGALPSYVTESLEG